MQHEQYEILSFADLQNNDAIRNEMHRDRALQFVSELGWNLRVDDLGREIDQYDNVHSKYIIIKDEFGSHIGSTRVAPTTETNMTKELFGELVDEKYQGRREIWESTRFFVSRRSKNRARDATRLMRAGVLFAKLHGVRSYIGVSAEKMIPLFAVCGWKPKVLGIKTYAGSNICGCVWNIDEFLGVRQ